MVYSSVNGDWFTQAEIDGLAQGYAQGRLSEWMLLDALDDDDLLVQVVKTRSEQIGSVDTGEPIVGLI